MLPDYLKNGTMCIKDVNDFRGVADNELLLTNLIFSYMTQGVVTYKTTIDNLEIVAICSMDDMYSMDFNDVEDINSLLDSDNIEIYYNGIRVLYVY